MTNHAGGAEVELALVFEADFADVFEVRGTRRERRGRYLEPVVTDDGVVLAYEGLDGLVRRTRLRFSPTPRQLTGRGARYALDLAPQQHVFVTVAAECEVGPYPSAAP